MAPSCTHRTFAYVSSAHRRHRLYCSALLCRLMCPATHRGQGRPVCTSTALCRSSAAHGLGLAPSSGTTHPPSPCHGIRSLPDCGLLPCPQPTHPPPLSAPTWPHTVHMRWKFCTLSTYISSQHLWSGFPLCMRFPRALRPVLCSVGCRLCPHMAA